MIFFSSQKLKVFVVTVASYFSSVGNNYNLSVTTLNWILHWSLIALDEARVLFIYFVYIPTNKRST